MKTYLKVHVYLVNQFNLQTCTRITFIIIRLMPNYANACVTREFYPEDE